jgi:cytochrome b561
MMNNYKNFTPSMKVLFWLAGVLILINFVCLVLMLFTNIGAKLLIASIITMPLTVILVLILAAKQWAMNNRDK